MSKEIKQLINRIAVASTILKLDTVAREKESIEVIDANPSAPTQITVSIK